MNKVMISIILLVSLAACSPEQVPNDPLDHFKSVKIEKLKYNIIDLEEYEVLRPWEVKRANGVYYLYNTTSTNVFTILNPTTGYCKHGVRMGNAPEEINTPRLEISGSEVTIYDISRSKRYRLVDEPGQELRIEPFQSVGVEILMMPTFYGNCMAARGRIGASWVRFYVDNVLRDSTAFPSFEETDYLSDSDKVGVFVSGRQKFKPDGSQLVASLIDGCAMAIYTCDGKSLKEKVMLEYYAPRFFKEDYGGLPITGVTTKSKVGFVDVTCSDKYIYALYSGRVLNDGIFDAYRGNQVLVYDWDGKPVKHYQLETDLVSFDVDAESGILYGIGYDPEACIFEYKL